MELFSYKSLDIRYAEKRFAFLFRIAAQTAREAHEKRGREWITLVRN
jgi:RNase P subunit RPR2